MEKYILLFTAVFAIASSNTVKHYRTDYVYNEKTDAFYKLHTVERRAWKTVNICKEEGAVVMLPLNHDDVAQVHGMFKPYTDLGDLVWIAADGLRHESAEQPALITFPEQESPAALSTLSCNVITRKGEVESMDCERQLPFVCKVEAKNAPYNSHCGTYGRNYHYESSVGSCYRISNIAYSWDEAYSECRAEGAHLAVINSVEERAIIHRLTQRKEVFVDRVYASHFFYLGFRAEEPVGDAPVVFKTIFNQTLQQAGFEEWSENEPNNDQGKEYCGTIFKNNGKFNDVQCSNLYVFICEKEIEESSM